jgi:Family of unknown function (DUF6049)
MEHHKGVRPPEKPLASTAAAAVLAVVMLVACLAPVAAAAPAGDADSVRLAFSKDAYWYKPGAVVHMKVTLDNVTRRAVSGISLRARVHARNETREELDACFEGKLKKVYKQTETYGPYTLDPGDNTLDLELELAASRYPNGVYPLSVEVLKSQDVLTSAVSELVVMSFDETEKLVPVKLTWIFDTLEQPHRDPSGNFTSDELARECSPAGNDPGWYSTLLAEIEKWQEMRFSLVLSPMLLEEMRTMTGGYTIKAAGKTRKVGPDSQQALNASTVLAGFARLPQSARNQLIPAAYASPDLERLVSLGWTEDAKQQLVRGHRLLEEILDTALSGEFSSPPGLRVNSTVVAELDDELGQFLVLSPDLLERSKEGRKILKGDDMGSPFFIKGATEERRDLALFADARMQKLLERVSASGDPHGVAQCAVAELANLYLEQPDKLRACAFVLPGSWHPSRDVLDELMRALNGAPWLSTATVAESMVTVPPADDVPVELPEPDSAQGAGEDEYFSQVGAARRSYAEFQKAVLSGNPLLEPLRRDVYVSESDMWRQLARKAEGLQYVGFVVATVNGELAKVEMPATGSITLTSGSANIPISVVNGTGYRMKAVLKYSSNGLGFPSGNTQQVLLERKENLFEIPVKTRKKGRVRFSVELSAGAFTLGRLDFTVLTSRFNTFAIMVVGGLLGLIGLAWVVKVLSRRKVGKHKRHQLKEAGAEENS